ncbi:anaerobic ribonucleoside-triphosphate reductase activating protein [Sulfurimonas paralvinellae]|uniref:Anaerobic ribonucleoside-triphosphate reductase activating protein n=1 Tax=Sulfurimonas paralvinellae TaxID=317658 RepID=A0A7M1B5E8_9BACT|nr:anaerobic ribonucleoside-triphosphate reductase activating protein [Sulfurimonas paralvinellae]QOP44967.1 anaerobic ribonucleoside-triphosphate reductase activating protein [Sulfurimonas paralvinellae]
MNTDSGFNSKNDKVIYDITKFTHLDYPNHLAAIFWFSGCNMRCDYCYNKDIVFAKSGNYTFEDALDFLRSRVNLLEGVVLSGGEATLHQLQPFCQAIKALGFLIKLDTNGTNPQMMQKLLEAKLIDYIALDYKAPADKFEQITHSRKYREFSQTLDLLMASDVKFEVRTTLHADLLDEHDINSIIKDLHSRGYEQPYFIQDFRETQNNIGDLKQAKKNFDKSLLLEAKNIIWR